MIYVTCTNCDRQDMLTKEEREAMRMDCGICRACGVGYTRSVFVGEAIEILDEFPGELCSSCNDEATWWVSSWILTNGLYCERHAQEVLDKWRDAYGCPLGLVLIQEEW